MLQIVLSHFAQSTEDLGPYESFAHRQLRTTMDVDCPEWLDFFHGGLHMQISHHLFPRIPRHRLREVSVRVRAFAARHADKGCRFDSWEFVEGNRKVLSVLEHVARQVGVLVAVAKTRPELH
jgi:delta8-fatty-acid desaturase